MMVALNLDKDTGRILCAYEIPSRHYAKGTVLVDNFPDGVLYEYRYVDGRYIHDPLPEEYPETDAQVASFSMDENGTDAKISELEEKINQLQKLVAELSNKS